MKYYNIKTNMNNTKNIIVLIIMALTSFYNAQNINKDDTKKYLFGLLKFDNKSPYEDGFWINKWLSKRILECHCCDSWHFSN